MFTSIKSNLPQTHGLSKLSCPVLIGRSQDHLWFARLLGWPECWAEGPTREEALKRLEKRLLEQLADLEVVQLEISLPQFENPLLRLAGKYKNDPDFEEVAMAIASYRREIDAEAGIELLNGDSDHEVA